MMIALIPVPAVAIDLNQELERQRLTAVDTQVLCKISVHQRHGGSVRIGVVAQVDNVRFSQNQRFIDPLPYLAVVFAKTGAQRVGLHHAFDDGFRKQWRINFTFQFNVVRHAPGVRQGRKLFCHPDSRLGGDKRKTRAHAFSSAK
ncbi:hypothetical protein D3C71_872920 [compost metagenome]